MTSPKATILTVSALTAHIKSLLEESPLLRQLTIVGEISNFKRHQPSGHLYFSLVDKGASISCVMFKREASRLTFAPESGMEVLLQGRVSLYEKSGRYQVYVDQMLPKGAGAKQLAYEALKAKLLAEGVLKDQASRRPLPAFPQHIGIVTSPTGAVIRDMVRVLRRRWPGVHILLAPAAVQGEEAGPSLCQALDRLYRQRSLELILIGRGGGSQEDLWAFNEEAVVRKVAASPVPIVSAVGHETDVTLTDFAADLRAGTPSMAAELAVPNQADLLQGLDQRVEALGNLANRRIETAGAQLTDKVRYAFVQRAADFLAQEAQNLDRAVVDLRRLQDHQLEIRKKDLASRASLLDGLSPLKVLARGFSVTEKEGQVVHRLGQIATGDVVQVTLTDGSFTAEVEEIHDRSH